LNDSFSIGRLFGIELRVHVMFVYLAIGMIALGAANGNGITTAAFLCMLVVLVLLHELGHARVAQHFGVTVVDIVLWPLGGMARMAALPEDPKVEGWVAVAGPLVNLALAAVGALGLLVTGGPGLIHPLEGEVTGLQSFLALFMVANLMLGLFNLVPAFPMDGGRLLRAFLGRKRTWLAATERAVAVSRAVAVTMIVSSFFVRPFNYMLALIGVYVLWEGTRELWITRLRHAGAGAFTLGGQAGPGGAAGPGGFDLAELFRRAREAQARQGGGQAPPEEPGGFEDSGADPPPQTSGGFSDEEVRRLEQFRGRLQRPDDEET
jgi:Zn-dependent protease